MLAPTRELVAELNRRARDHRLDGAPAGQEVRLGDGNQASVGDMIITRTNDRRLRLSATDWVKNGDRWTITHINRSGGLTVRHGRSQLKCQLPADYVTASTGLGYATTIHDSTFPWDQCLHQSRGGSESRQQLYTMLTRGRHANDLYLQVVGDGDPHSLIQPETISSRTPTETLQQILGRDEAPVSATTVLRQFNSPAARLFQAVQRYTDGLHVAAEQLLGPQIVQTLDTRANQVVPHLTNEPSWSTLRAHLLNLAAESGEHPLLHLQTAAAGRELHTAGDMAAVLYWRLPELMPTNRGPLPWLPGIPEMLHAHPVWGAYLTKRSQLVADLADQVQDHASQSDGPPAWAAAGRHPTALIGEITVWRAANGINPHDPRPTGGTQLETLPALWKQRLDRDIARATYPPGDSRPDERQAAHTALKRLHDHSQRPHQKTERRPSGPAAPRR
jgi:hypothetical protein